MATRRHGNGYGNETEEKEKEKEKKKPKQRKGAGKPLPWGLADFFRSVGRPDSPALAADLFTGGVSYDE
jgi:hypothetical protein